MIRVVAGCEKFIEVMSVQPLLNFHKLFYCGQTIAHVKIRSHELRGSCTLIIASCQIEQEVARGDVERLDQSVA